MRIEQLIISTVPSSKMSTLPPIITDANIKLLFDIQERVDNLTAPFQVTLSYQALVLHAQV